MEDHNYSLGPNSYDVTDEECAVEPCTTTCTPEPKDQSLLPECDVIYNKMNVAIDITGGKRSAANTALQFLMMTLQQTTNFLVVPHLQKKIVVFESELYKLLTKCHDCDSPVDSTTQKCNGNMVTITTNCISGHIVSWKSQPSVEAMRLETY